MQQHETIEYLLHYRKGPRKLKNEEHPAQDAGVFRRKAFCRLRLIQLDESDSFSVLKCFPLLILCCSTTAEEVSFVSSSHRLQLTNCI